MTTGRPTANILAHEFHASDTFSARAQTVKLEEKKSGIMDQLKSELATQDARFKELVVRVEQTQFHTAFLLDQIGKSDAIEKSKIKEAVQKAETLEVKELTRFRNIRAEMGVDPRPVALKHIYSPTTETDTVKSGFTKETKEEPASQANEASQPSEVSQAAKVPARFEHKYEAKFADELK